ncbi:hypothetical protein GE21DRAFT_1321363 [Neurospora crassa]|nr:hypothetical protein GE21DRAFT_1321363 [Neurospora crassa]
MPGVLPSVRQGGHDAVVPGIFAEILSRSGEASGCGRTRMVIAGALKTPSEVKGRNPVLWGPGPLGMTHCLQPASMLHILVVQKIHGTFTMESLHGASELPEVLSRPDRINTKDFASGASAILRCNCERNMFN